MKKFVLKKGVRFLGREGRVAALLNFGRRQFVEGALVDERFEACLKTLERPSDMDRLTNELRSSCDSVHIEKLIALLNKQNLLESIEQEDVSAFQSDDSYLHFLGQLRHGRPSSINAYKVVQNSKVCLIDHLNLGDELRNLVSDFQVTLADYDAADFIVVLSSWLMCEELLSLGEKLFDDKKLWMLATLDYFGGSIGPVFYPEEPPCFACLADRRRSHLTHFDRQQMMENIWRKEGMEMPVLFSPYQKIMSQMIAIEVFKTLSRSTTTPLVRGLVEVDLLNYRNAFYEIFPTPYCKVCSDIDVLPFRAGPTA